VRTKDLCWSMGTIYNPRELPEVSTTGLGVDGVLHIGLIKIHKCYIRHGTHKHTLPKLEH
jgi:hypothetical protein